MATLLYSLVIIKLEISNTGMNGDGVINSLDQVPIGHPTSPEINYGFGSTFSYKGLTSISSSTARRSLLD